MTVTGDLGWLVGGWRGLVWFGLNCDLSNLSRNLPYSSTPAARPLERGARTLTLRIRDQRFAFDFTRPSDPESRGVDHLDLCNP